MPRGGATRADMSERKPYSYVLLRYRHDPLAGEFVNVGVLLHAPVANFVGIKVRKTLGRLGKMFPGISKSDFTASVTAIERAARKLLPSSSILQFPSELTDAAKFAAVALPPDNSSYVWGPLCTGLAADPQETLDRLYERFVSRFDDEVVSRREDSAIWQPVREKLAAKRLIDKLQPKVVVSPLDEVHFGSAWKNGAWHCYQALSFDLTTREGIREKAARWSGHMLGASKSDEEIRPYFLVGAPSEEGLNEDYQRAIQLLRASALSPAVFEETQIDVLVDQIVSKMATKAGAAE